MASKRDITERYDDCQISRQPEPPIGGAVAHGHSHDHAEGPGHDHAGHDAHGGHHAHVHTQSTRRLAWACGITAAFVVAEVVGGWISNSVALLADAGHMLTDVGALALSLFVAWFSRQPATPKRTYGYLRWEILAALINGAVLLVLSFGILWEAFRRLANPEPVESGLMLGIAVGGLLVNALSAWLLHASADASLNLRGAYLHVLSDLLGSVAVIIAALAVRWFGWLQADSVASIVVTVLIVRGAWRLVREAVDVLLESTPAHVDVEALRGALLDVRGVKTVHDLHVWTLTSGVVAMSAHAIAPDGDHQRVLEELHGAVARFGIQHTTIQLEGEPLAACCEPLASSLTPVHS
ncbi:MAG: cation transporter [Gemmatimonadaceae bacterium]|nr:cation transporter [Gemmatimonadaceae bacterium]